MRTTTNGLAPGTDVVWENSTHGIGGWATMIVGSRNGSGNVKALVGNDTQGLNIKDVTADTDLTLALTPANCSGISGLFDWSGVNPSAFGADWAGASNVNFWAITSSKVLYFNGTNCLDKTPSGGISVIPGSGERYRQVAQRCASDPVQGNVFVGCFGSAGWKYTLDGGSTYTAPTGVPAPLGPSSDDAGAWVGLISWDTTSSRTGTAPADRYSRAALSSHGNGVYLTTNGLVAGSKISPTSPHALDYVSALLWVGGTLYAIASDVQNWGNNATNNLWKWSGSGTTWTQLTNAGNKAWFTMVADPRTAGALILNTPSGDYSYTSDPATPSAYGDWTGGNGVTPLQQIKTKKRPFISNIYRKGGGGFAPGPLAVIGGYLYYLLGYGLLRTPISSFPTAGAYQVPPYSAVNPSWEEDCAGYEAVVGQTVAWVGSRLLCLGQDVGAAVFYEKSAGHDCTHLEFPGGALTNGVGASSGVSDRNFACVGALKGGPFFGYTNDGANTFAQMTNKPVSGNLSGGGPGGAVVAGPNLASGWCQFFPSFSGVPQYTDDLGATAWKNLTFYTSSSGTSGQLNMSYADNGFHGAAYYANHWCSIADPNNPGVYYAYNIGGSSVAGNSSFQSDPLGYAGVYKMNVNTEPGVYRRVKAGQLITWGNTAFYTLYLSITADNHLLIMPNPLNNGNNVGNNWVDVNLTDNTSRVVSIVYDLDSLAIGPPLVSGGAQGLWAVGWYSGSYGLWLSFDRFQTAPYGPSGTPFNFNHAMPKGGHIKHLVPHPTIFGLLGAALDQGHARGKLQL